MRVDRPFDDKPAWAIIWKQDATSVMRDCLLSFGMAPTIEEALARVAAKLAADPYFRRDFAGGVFYAVAVHNGLPVRR